MNIAQGLNLISYGTEDDLYVNGQITDNSPYLAFEWKAGKDGERHQVRTQLIGEYNFPECPGCHHYRTFLWSGSEED